MYSYSQIIRWGVSVKRRYFPEVHYCTLVVYSYGNAPNDPNTQRKEYPQWQPKSLTQSCNSFSAKDFHKMRLPNVLVSPAQLFSGDFKNWVYRKDTKVYL